MARFERPEPSDTDLRIIALTKAVEGNAGGSDSQVVEAAEKFHAFLSAGQNMKSGSADG